VEEPPSKEEEKSTLKVELKPLPSHRRYEFLDLDYKFFVIVSSKLDGPQLKNYWMCLERIWVQLGAALMI